MIISHEHKYVFIEVPHTASTAISRELTAHYGGERFLWKHANFSEFWHAVGSAERGYFKFAAVRNPLDAAVTLYYKLKNDHKGAYSDPSKHACNGGWVENNEIEMFRFIHDRDSSFPEWFQRFHSSVYNNWFLVGHPYINVVMRYEKITEDFTAVLNRLGFDSPRPLPQTNKTRRPETFAENYTSEIQDLALRVFGPFMEKWNYTPPAEWKTRAVPMHSTLRFFFATWASNRLAKFMNVSQRNGRLTRLKNLVISK